jgi:hypothetical protein
LCYGHNDISSNLIRVHINKKLKKVEFDDGSEWTLYKCLTHANRTSKNKNLEVVYRWVYNNLATLKQGIKNTL